MDGLFWCLSGWECVEELNTEYDLVLSIYIALRTQQKITLKHNSTLREVKGQKLSVYVIGMYAKYFCDHL